MPTMKATVPVPPYETRGLGIQKHGTAWIDCCLDATLQGIYESFTR